MNLMIDDFGDEPPTSPGVPDVPCPPCEGRGFVVLEAVGRHRAGEPCSLCHGERVVPPAVARASSLPPPPSSSR